MISDTELAEQTLSPELYFKLSLAVSFYPATIFLWIPKKKVMRKFCNYMHTFTIFVRFYIYIHIHIGYKKMHMASMS